MSNFTGSFVLQKENGDKVIIPNRITEKGYDFWTGKDISLVEKPVDELRYGITKEGILELNPPVTNSEVQSSIQRSAQLLSVSRGSAASYGGLSASRKLDYGTDYSVISNTFTPTLGISNNDTFFTGTIYEFSLKNYSNSFVYTNRIVTDSTNTVITGEYLYNIQPTYVLSLRVKNIQKYNIQLNINSVNTDCVLQIELLNEAAYGTLLDCFLKNYTILKSTGTSGDLKLLFESFDLQTKKLTYNIVIAAADIVGNYITLSTNFGKYKISLLNTDGAPLDFPKNGTDLILPLVINM